MLSITTDVVSLSQAQRESLAAFILSFPASQVVEDEDEGSTLTSVSFPDISEHEETPIFDAPLPAGVLAFPSGGPSQVDPPASAVTAGGTGIDKNGLPWDDRIHASSKARNADGSWRYKRGVESRLVDQVQAELKAVMGLPIQQGFPGGLPAPLTQSLPSALAITQSSVGSAAPVIPFAAPVTVTTTPAFASNPIPPPPAVPAAAAVPSITASPVVSAPPVVALNPFVSLITFAGAKNMEGKLTDAEIQAACIAVGVPAIPLMTNRHDLCPYVEQSLRLLVSTR